MSIAEKATLVEHKDALASGEAPLPINIAERLMQMAARFPNQDAIVTQRLLKDGSYDYAAVSFKDLAADVRQLSNGLRDIGITPGKRIVLMVRPSVEFVALTFALFRIGAVTVLIDPGMGRKNLLQCLEDVKPDGFVAIPLAHAVRIANRRRFPNAKLNVTVGRRWFWGGATIEQLREGSQQRTSADENSATETCKHETRVDDHAAIIFTTGSTGPPKGVLYTHGNFQAQVEQIRDRYKIEPGSTDVAGFPLFGLFNGAMGTTTLIPDMDASRPANVNPANIVDAVRRWSCEQSFASPAVWNVVGKYCDENDIELPTLKRVLSAGAPVPVHVMKRLQRTIRPDGEIYTPYGATESLPVASISATEVLTGTAKATSDGEGVCVGTRFAKIDWRVIEINDGPLAHIDDTRPLEQGEIGELIVRGPQVTSRYVTREDQNELHKVADDGGVWHRIGDVGYLDGQERFWFCGRKAHRVVTPNGTMFTIPCEAVTNSHPKIYRSALVGVGLASNKTPVMICEPHPSFWPVDRLSRSELLKQLADRLAKHELTSRVKAEHVLLHRSFPVDIRHNAKIFRERLSEWAAKVV